MRIYVAAPLSLFSVSTTKEPHHPPGELGGSGGVSIMALRVSQQQEGEKREGRRESLFFAYYHSTTIKFPFFLLEQPIHSAGRGGEEGRKSPHSKLLSNFSPEFLMSRPKEERGGRKGEKEALARLSDCGSLSPFSPTPQSSRRRQGVSLPRSIPASSSSSSFVFHFSSSSPSVSFSYFQRIFRFNFRDEN